MKRIKIALVGTGFFAAHAHGPALQLLAHENSDVELVGAADPDGARVREFSAKFGFKNYYTDYREMLERERPDGVVVAVNVAATVQVASDIMRRGYPVLLEKPPGRNLVELKLLQEAAKSNGNRVMVAFNRRYSPVVRALLACWKRESNEDIEMVRCEFQRYERFDADFATTAIHAIDTTSFLAGAAYREVNFTYHDLLRDDMTLSMALLTAKFAGTALGVLSIVPSAGEVCERYTLQSRNWTLTAELPVPGTECREGGIRLYRNGHSYGFEPALAGRLQEFEVYRSGCYSENAAFVGYLTHGFPVFDDLAFSLPAVEIAEVLRQRGAYWEKSRCND